MKQITAVIIGAGIRGGHVYAGYALEYPNEMKVVAVAEPRKERRDTVAKLHHIPEDMQFESYEALLSRDRLADCAVICTQDAMHYKPVTKALEKGYHVLCEKPISPNRDEIVKIGAMAQKYDKVLSICHVLRYSAFFVKIKALLEEGRIGQLMNIAHIESVGFWHQAHSFVRGNWRNAQESSPMILQKCCHDMDIILWLVGSACKKISSFGELTYFTAEHAPAEAPKYCLDGCPKRDECAFYAPRFYLEHPKAVEDDLVKAVSADTSSPAILDALKKGPYGRCVFQCDNTVVDHQVVSIEFENEVNVSLTMSAFTRDCGREINIMGSKGQLLGDMERGTITIYDFVTGSTDLIKLNTQTKGHSGSDAGMMKDFVKLIAEEGQGIKRTSADISVESHLMALAAEQSRIVGQTIDFRKYKKESYGVIMTNTEENNKHE